MRKCACTFGSNRVSLRTSVFNWNNVGTQKVKVNTQTRATRRQTVLFNSNKTSHEKTQKIQRSYSTVQTQGTTNKVPGSPQSHLTSVELKGDQHLVPFGQEWYDLKKYAELFEMIQKKQYKQVEKYFYAQIGSGRKIDTAEYEAVMLAYENTSELSAALRLFNKMEQLGEFITRGMFHSIIRLFAEKKQPDMMRFYFEKMKKRGLHPETSTFMTLIKANRELGDMKEMLSYFEEMKQLGLKPTVGIYNEFLFGFEENGEEEAITAWIDHMKTENVPLNEASYLALLKLYHRLGKSKEAELAFHEMKQNKKLKPNPAHYAHLIGAYAANDDIQAMNALFEEMQREKVKKTDAVYHVFFKFYAKTRQIQEMKKLFAQMRDEKAQPTLPTLNLLEQSFRASKDEEAVKLCLKLKNEYAWKVDPTEYDYKRPPRVEKLDDNDEI